MSHPDILVAGRMPPNVLDQLEASFTVHCLPEAADEAQMMIDAVGERIRGVATNAVQAPQIEMLERLPRLEIMASSGIGTDALNVDYAGKRGIHVTNTPDVLTDDVADAAIMLMLATSRQLVLADRNVRAGCWLKGLSLAHRVSGKRLGILGLGRIGQAIAKRAAAFDMPIGYHQRHINPDVSYTYYHSPTALAADSDFLVVVVPGGSETDRMVDAAVMDALGPEGILVNIGRGTTVDEPALIEALTEGRIRGAGLDVLADEPNVPDALRTLDNVVLAPHYASATMETRLAMGQLVVDNLRAHFDGRTLLTPVG